MSYDARHLGLLSLSLSLAFSSFISSHAVAANKALHTRTSYAREYQLADQMLQTGRYDAAEAQYLALLKKNPNNTSARSALSLAQARAV